MIASVNVQIAVEESDSVLLAQIEHPTMCDIRGVNKVFLGGLPNITTMVCVAKLVPEKEEQKEEFLARTTITIAQIDRL